jgi:hypothetical protein
MSPLGKMRDPVENKDWVETLYTRGGEPENVLRDLHRMAIRTLWTTKVLSFTLEHDPPAGSLPHARGYARPRMWEQYSENHHGVCLVFDKDLLSTALMTSLPAFADTHSGEVRYSDRPLPGSEDARVLNAVKLRQLGGDDVEEGLHRHLNLHVEELFFRKLEDWSSEAELRFLLLDRDTFDINVPYGDSLRAVIVGERFPRWQLAGAAHLCSHLGVDLLQMQWGPSPPGVFDPMSGDEPEPRFWTEPGGE